MGWNYPQHLKEEHVRKIPINEAVGLTLCHDITQIVPEQVKRRAFKRGHVIEAEDIPILLNLGKEHIYVWEDDEGLVMRMRLHWPSPTTSWPGFDHDGAQPGQGQSRGQH